MTSFQISMTSQPTPDGRFTSESVAEVALVESSPTLEALEVDSSSEVPEERLEVSFFSPKPHTYTTLPLDGAARNFYFFLRGYV